jgi:iron complex outermembrane receptor protein
MQTTKYPGAGQRPIFTGSLAVLLSGASLVLVGSTARATEAATDAGADTSSGSRYNLSEVVVTARRREEKLADVPLAETVKSGAELQQESAVLFEDAFEAVPNTLAFKSARSVSALEVTMRGQTAIGGTIVNPGGLPVASWQAAADRRLYGLELEYRFQSRR